MSRGPDIAAALRRVIVYHASTGIEVTCTCNTELVEEDVYNLDLDDLVQKVADHERDCIHARFPETGAGR